MTYSIVARDPLTGRYGVAVQSHAYTVGPIVPWLEAGVGAIATQAFVNVGFGPIGLEMLRNGWSAEKVIAALVAGDETPEQRQIGVVDTQGRAAAYTGSACVPAAGGGGGGGFPLPGDPARGGGGGGAPGPPPRAGVPRELPIPLGPVPPAGGGPG